MFGAGELGEFGLFAAVLLGIAGGHNLRGAGTQDVGEVPRVVSGGGVDEFLGGGFGGLEAGLLRGTGQGQSQKRENEFFDHG